MIRRWCENCKQITDHSKTTLWHICLKCEHAERRYDLRHRTWAGV